MNIVIYCRLSIQHMQREQVYCAYLCIYLLWFVQTEVLDCGLDLMRRMRPSNIEEDLAGKVFSILFRFTLLSILRTSIVPSYKNRIIHSHQPCIFILIISAPNKNRFVLPLICGGRNLTQMLSIYVPCQLFQASSNWYQSTQKSFLMQSISH